MKGLIHEDDWLKEVINEHDLNNWNPEIEACCTAQQFKLHLVGTTCHPWNISATRVFADHFLTTHADKYPDVWGVHGMVLRKTRAYIKSLIRSFNQNRHGDDLKRATKQAKNQRERKTNLYHRRRDITFEYPQMAPQQQMLEVLGVDGMSSDEEEKVEDGIQYQILTPRWRAPMLTPWLRMFDAIYRHHRLEDNASDMRGSLPRRRVATSSESTSKRFVPGLPINAYRTDWLEGQLDIANVVHPAPGAKYTHDPQLAQYVLTPCHILSS
ncbi:hypothetical protein BDM02DRAFT_3105986 [Thelephora ganbajun]|uniref:Uncharacterized protein n=1 Tax=Thelephora ganbajun TaxID=370292 RepID=A0ACB6YXI4_THEGA|nr:hypothetical protein BDM02DRAFT_3105986 [Thelephora ganbajun]